MVFHEMAPVIRVSGHQRRWAGNGV